MKSDEQSAWVVVIASLAVACALVAIGTLFVAESDALPTFANLAIVLACLAAALSGRLRSERHGGFVAVVAIAFWTIGLWVLWRTWRVVGGIYDRMFPEVSHDRVWRIVFQLVSIPTVALVLQVALIWLLVRLNELSKRRRIEDRRPD